jgi:transcription elongation GreA/GreB family factor
LIDGVEIIDSDKKASEKIVWFWSRVIVQIEDDDPCEVIIVWTWEVKYQHNGDFLISFESPVWQAIRGKKAWDTVKMRLNNERKDVKIISVK